MVLKNSEKSLPERVCFLGTVDIQATLPTGNPEAICKEAEDLIKYWSTPNGGFIVFNYGASEAIGTTDAATKIMFEKFYQLKNY